jgi:hypothetical protein
MEHSFGNLPNDPAVLTSPGRARQGRIRSARAGGTADPVPWSYRTAVSARSLMSADEAPTSKRTGSFSTTNAFLTVSQ